MKRKETKPSPVKTKKGRASLESAPTPLQASVVEQRRKAREWFEQEEEKRKSTAGSSSASDAPKSRSATPTSKTPSKKAKQEEPEERPTRSTRNTARSETPSNKRRSSKEKKEEVVGEESEQEEPAPAPAPRSRKAASKATPEVEQAPEVKTPSAKNKKSRASLESAQTPAEPATVEEQRQKAKDWAAKEAESNKPRTPKSTAKTPATTPKLTPEVRNRSNTAASDSRQASAAKNVASPLPAEPARCPFSALGGPNPHESTSSCTEQAGSSCCDDSCNLCGVTMALAVIPVGAIGYYDPKIAVTTLVIMIVLSALRRIFRMIAVEEEACPA